MKKNFKLLIPKPCHERWENFTPTNNGGFCSSCQKNVIDFTKLSESQLIAFFKDHSANNQSFCGRFRDDQLQKNYDINAWFPEWHIEAKTLSYEVPVFRTQKQIKLPVIQRMKAVRNLTMAVLTFVFVEQGYAQTRHLTGQVVDSEGLAIPGVNILVKGTERGVASDDNGKYELIVNDQDTLIYSFIGYKADTLSAIEVKPLVKMEEDVMGLGEVVVTGFSNSNCTSLVGGLTFVSSINEESDFRQYNTQLKALGNPTVQDAITIVPQIVETSGFANATERDLIEAWYTEHAFQQVVSVQVYDMSGRVFATTYHKVNDGKIIVNLKNVHSGVYIIRMTYSNEKSLYEVQSATIRIIVEK